MNEVENPTFMIEDLSSDIEIRFWSGNTGKGSKGESFRLDN